MENFIKARDAVHSKLDSMTQNDFLFEVNIDKDEFWNLYLDSFPAGYNNMFRERREYDCSCCRGFIKNIGNVIAIKDGEVDTIWNVDPGTDEFRPVFKALDAYLRTYKIEDIYLSIFKKLGMHHNFEIVDGHDPIEWNHFYYELPNKFVVDGYSKPTKLARYRDAKNVLKRSLDEFSVETIQPVLDLCEENILYKGNEWILQLRKLLELKNTYDALDDSKKDYWMWETSVSLSEELSEEFCKIRNTSIGKLLIDVASGMDLEEAVKRYEVITAPTNYKRSKPVFSKKMLEEAQNKITKLGYLDSLPRRFATTEDITVNNILYINRDVKNKELDIFGELLSEVTVNPKKYDNVTEITSNEFIEKILPTAKKIELLLENKHKSNMCSLIAPMNKDAKSMFKWNNSISWAYSGNITDSDIKSNVKFAGGNTDGDLRFSIMWNESGTDNSDLDAHCVEQFGYLGSSHIYYGNKKSSKTSGELDVDIQTPKSDTRAKNGVAVENIVYVSKKHMIPGEYKFYVNQYAARGTKGFKAEIEIEGTTYSYEYNKPVYGNVPVAIVTLDKNGVFTIKHYMDTNTSIKSTKVWDVNTNQFIPVSIVCYSPNYWDEHGIGHKHLMFMLENCKNEENPNGFYNEYLNNELYPAHRKVFEALSEKCKVETSNDQLSGVGFSMSKRQDVVVKVDNKLMKILF